jgi:hypothetical protein
MARRDGCDALGVKVGEHKEIIEAGRAADIYRSGGSISGASETTLENEERWRVGDVRNVLARRDTPARIHLDAADERITLNVS